MREIQADLPADTDALIALVEHHGEQLSAAALALGARVYSEKPTAFERRLHAYWKAWRTEAALAARQRPEKLAAITRHPATA